MALPPSGVCLWQFLKPNLRHGVGLLGRVRLVVEDVRVELGTLEERAVRVKVYRR
jgi:hypothetical protein